MISSAVRCITPYPYHVIKIVWSQYWALHVCISLIFSIDQGIIQITCPSSSISIPRVIHFVSVSTTAMPVMEQKLSIRAIHEGWMGNPVLFSTDHFVHARKGLYIQRMGTYKID